ncbi:MAG TPA: acylphosphatase [Gaiellaceae bacterium]
MTRTHVRIRGRVQGVFFRAEARARAESLGLAGWIRNAEDGSVEAVFEGDEERVRSMVDWCSRGPSGARVDEVDAEAQEPSGESGFRVR